MIAIGVKKREVSSLYPYKVVGEFELLCKTESEAQEIMKEINELMQRRNKL